MDKRTIIAIAISAVIFIGYIVFTNVLFPPKKSEETTQTSTVQKPVEPAIIQSPVTAVATEKEITEESKVVHTRLFDVTFSNKGAVVTSIKLNDTDNDPENSRLDDGIEMVSTGSAEKSMSRARPGEYPFTIYFGTYKTNPVTDLFEMQVAGDYKLDFIRDFEFNGKKVTVKKSFEVIPDQYHIKMIVRLENAEAEGIPFDFNGVLYTVGIGPQIGPEFNGVKPEQQSDYRRFVILGNGRSEIPSGSGSPSLFGGCTAAPQFPITQSGVFEWAALTGKYYTVILSTGASIKNLVLDSQETGLPFLRSAIYLERKREITQALTDEYMIFVGPKKHEVLGLYPDKKYSEIAPITFPFGTLAQLFKYPLDFFAKVGNYGVAIIFLTILIKILLFPLSIKSFNSMRKMQGVNPKLQELRTRYKDDPKRLNLEMAALYKREGISPLGGCLPQLLQFPILISLIFLFSEHFGLKNAVFIPGWINDLSVPESIVQLPFTIPLLGWSHIRLLPFIMLGTQLLATFFGQQQTMSTDSKMKYLPYILMAVFFFWLYEYPAGLVLYWTIQNILTVLQTMLQKFFADRKMKMTVIKAG